MKIVILFLLFMSTLLNASILTDVLLSTLISPILNNINIVFIALLAVALAIFGLKKVLYLFETSEKLYNMKQNRGESHSSSFFQIKDTKLQKTNREKQYAKNRENKIIQKANHEKVKSLRSIRHNITNLQFEKNTTFSHDKRVFLDLEIHNLRTERDKIIASQSSNNTSYKDFDTNRGNKYSYQRKK